jgi:hypothetical protein
MSPNNVREDVEGYIKEEVEKQEVPHQRGNLQPSKFGRTQTETNKTLPTCS